MKIFILNKVIEYIPSVVSGSLKVLGEFAIVSGTAVSPILCSELISSSNEKEKVLVSIDKKENNDYSYCLCDYLGFLN